VVQRQGSKNEQGLQLLLSTWSQRGKGENHRYKIAKNNFWGWVKKTQPFEKVVDLRMQRRNMRRVKIERS